MAHPEQVGPSAAGASRPFPHPLVLWETTGQWAPRIRQLDPVLGAALRHVHQGAACWTAAVQGRPAVVLVEFGTARLRAQLELVWRLRGMAPEVLTLGLADRRWEGLEIGLRELGPLQVALRTLDWLPLAAMILRWEERIRRTAPGGAPTGALIR